MKNDFLPDDFRKIVVQGLLIFEGNIIIHKINVLPFKVGEELFGIGDGKKSTGSNRSICMSKKIIYAGTAYIENTEWVLFQIPNQYFTGLNLFNCDTPHYLALINNKNENVFFIQEPDIPKVRCVVKQKILENITERM